MAYQTSLRNGPAFSLLSLLRNVLAMNQPHFAPGYVISVLLAIGLAAACSADAGTLTLADDGFAEVSSTGDGDIDATRGMTPGSGTAGTAATGSDRTTLVGEIGFFS